MNDSKHTLRMRSLASFGWLLSSALLSCSTEQRDLNELVKAPAAQGGSTGGVTNTSTQSGLGGEGTTGGTSEPSGGSTSTGGFAGNNFGEGGASTGGAENIGGNWITSGGASSTTAATGGIGGLAATGGASGSGGLIATGGTLNPSVGGTFATGGTVNSTLGGTLATGGTTSSSTGGTLATGGAPITGGMQGTGGTQGNGTATGGLTASGGTSSLPQSATGGSATGGASSATGGASSATGGASSATGGSSTTLVCNSTPTSMACSGVCVDVATDAQNCRVCGHDCGFNSACVSGQCQPVAIYTSTNSIEYFDVDDANIVFSPPGTTACGIAGCDLAPKTVSQNIPGAQRFLANGYVLVSYASGHYTGFGLCPTSGCTSANTIDFGSNNQEVTIHTVTASEHNFYGSMTTWQGSGLYTCVSPPSGSCGLSNSVLGIATSSLLVSDSAIFFQSDADSVWYACSTSSLTTCTSPTSMKLQYPIPPYIFGAYGNDLYFYLPAGPPPNQVNALRKCPSTGCGTAGILLGDVTNSPVGEAAIDASGVYWTSQNGIKMCPLSGCVGAPIDVAPNVLSASKLRVNSRFVYWVNPAENKIYRIAKP